MSREQFYTTSKISKNQELTHDGYLICLGTPIARTGSMLYGPDETPVEIGANGVVHIYREDEDVFNDLTIASALGKPITLSHPDDDVTPDTWKDKAHGITLNVRRGTGAMDDLLLADLMITTKEAIEAVQNGLVEISMGYDADYEQIEPGKGRQSNIIFNHTALVEQGRCGSRCAIKDEKTITTTEEKSMANRYEKKKVVNKKGLAKFVDLLFRANKAKDAEELNDIINEAAEDELMAEENVGNLPATNDEDIDEQKDIHIHIHNGGGQEVMGAETTSDEEESEDTKVEDGDDQWAQNKAEHDEFRSRLDAIEAKLGLTQDTTEEEQSESFDDGEEIEEFLEEEAPEGVKALDARKAKDSRYLEDSMKSTVAAAEILAPGIRMPTFDRASKPSLTAKKICSFRKKALDTAYAIPSNKAIFTNIIGNRTLDTSRMTCDAIRVLFKSASALKANGNNASGTKDSMVNLQNAVVKPMTLEEINAKNKAFYSNK
jgi:hypothetical protein